MRTKKANAKAAETRVADSNPLLDYPERFLGEMKRLHYSADSIQQYRKCIADLAAQMKARQITGHRAC